MRGVDNYDFITIEDVNSVIINHGMNFEEYYDINTLDLEDDLSINYTNYRIDFSLVSRTFNGEVYEYILEIRNSLWDGSYIFTVLPSNLTKNDVRVVQVESNPNILRITGKNLTYFTIRLKLNNNADLRALTVSNIKLEGITDITSYYYETNNQVLRCVDTNGQPIQDVTITMKGDQNYQNGLTQTVTTDINGYATLVYPAAEVGVYTCTVIASKSEYGRVIRTVKVHKNKFKIQIEHTETFKLKKGAIETVTANIKIADNYNINDTLIKINAGNGYSTTATVKNNTISFDLNLRNYYNDTLALTYVIPATSYNPAQTFTESATCYDFIADTYADIVSECADTKGTDRILLKNGTTYTHNGTTISITRDMKIYGIKGTSWAVIDGNKNWIMGTTSAQTSDNYVNLEVKGIKFYRGNNAIFQHYYSNLTVEECLFENCFDDRHNQKGSAIYCQENLSLKNSNRFTTTILNSYFYNCMGNAITSCGTTTITGSTFYKNNKDWLYQPEPYALIQSYGSALLYKNTFCLDTGDSSINTNSSYAKVILFCGSTATVNNKTRDELNADNTLNIYKDPYNNIAYTYCIYYYPYEPVATTIVASPKKGYERKAGGHAVQSKNWAWQDGYQLTRLSWGTQNRNNKLVVTIPAKGGYV